MASNNVVRVQSTSTFSRFVFPPAPPTGETYNGFGQGSGVLISPVLYLTAAHVLDWLADRQGPFDQFLGSSFSVQSGPVPANQPAYQHDLTAANFFRGYVLGAGVRVADPTDVALVRLSSPTGLTGEDVAFFVDRPTQTTALITGYPSSADPDGNTQTDSSVTVLAARGNGVLDLSSGPGKGASGGAIFMDIGPNNDRAVVGVYTERSSSADPNHHGVYLRYQDLQNIRSTLEAAEQGFGPAALPRIHIVGSQRGDIIRGTHRNEVLYGDAGADIIYTGHMPLNPVTPNLIYPGPGADIVIVGNGVTVIEEEENSPEFDRLAILLEAIAPNMTVAGPEEDVAAEQILVLRGGAYLVGNAGEVGGDGVYYTSERPDGSNALGTNLFVRVDFDLPAGILPGASNGSPHLFITITIYRNGPNGRETVGESGVIVENFQSGDFGLTFINIGIVDIEAWDDFSSDLLTPTLQAIPDIDFAQNDDPTDVNGTSGADVLTGTIESESLFGQGGNDSISGLAGHDVMIGGDGNDTLSGDDGRDAIQGDAGDDALNGGAGDDIIEGGAGNDAMDGGAGGDTYAFFAGSGNDTITENPDGGAIDRVQITGLNPANVILRQSSNNLLVTIAHTSEELTILGHFASMSSGIELLVFADGTTWDRGQIGSNLWTGGTSGDDTLTGTSGDDFLQGLAGNDSVSGGDGNDVLEGNGENDVLSGGAGNDTLRGNAGNDTYNGGSGTDTVVLDGTRAAWTPGVGSGLYTLYNGTLGTDSYATDVEFVTFSDTTNRDAGFGAGARWGVVAAHGHRTDQHRLQ